MRFTATLLSVALLHCDSLCFLSLKSGASVAATVMVAERLVP